MKNIAILSASVRTGRKSHRVALYFKNYLMQHELAKVNIIDLKEYNFPLFEERLSNFPNPTAQMLAYAEAVKKADGIILVTPEYNGGYPASLKNAIDLLYPEWKRKPIAISTVSAGPFAGTQVITSLQFSLWKIGALTIPAMFPVPTIDKSFDENGTPSDPEAIAKRADIFVKELLFWIEAKQKLEQ